MRIAMILAFSLIFGGFTCSAQYAPVVGKQHMDFTLPHIETREPVSLSDFRGKPVLLIHFASW